MEAETRSKPLSRWLRDVSFEIIERENDEYVDIRIFVRGELFSRINHKTPFDAGTEIGAAIFEEAR